MPLLHNQKDIDEFEKEYGVYDGKKELLRLVSLYFLGTLIVVIMIVALLARSWYIPMLAIGPIWWFGSIYDRKY